MKNHLADDHKKGIKSTYIPSSESPADMISQGVDINQFVNRLKFWQHGPSLLTKGSNFWPSSTVILRVWVQKLEAVGSELYFTNSDWVNSTPIIDVQRFSTFAKLCNSTALMFEFINFKMDAKLYLIKYLTRTRLIAFHIALMPLGKVCIQLFSLQPWVNSRAD